MKRVISLLIILVGLTSCNDDVKFNNPSVQGLKDNVLWRANDSRATIGANGSLTIEGYTEDEVVTLKTSSFVAGTYVLGTINQTNTASYVSSGGVEELEYKTIVVPGSVSGVVLSSGGSGYVQATSVITTGGSGFGLRVDIKVNAAGVVTQVKVAGSPGSGYKAGDLITISGGNGSAKFFVQNVSKSNGEIIITNYDGSTVTGSFKFNAVNTNSSSTEPEVLNYHEGHFYKVPIN
jgi:hypothetical protein